MRRRRRVWAWVALSVALLLAEVGAGTFLFRSLWPPATTTEVPPSPTPASPSRSDPSPSPTPASSGPVLAGEISQVAYLQTARSIVRLDLGAGEVVTTPTQDLEQFSSFVAGQGWVIFKDVDDGGGVVVRDGQQGAALPEAFQRPGRLYPIARDRMWLLDEESTDGILTAIDMDVAGRRVSRRTVEIPDAVGYPDWAHGGVMLGEQKGAVYRADPSGLHRVAPGALVAAGPLRLLTWVCGEGERCDAHLTRIGGSSTTLTSLHRTLLTLWGGEGAGEGGVLSPDGRWAALAVPCGPLAVACVVVLDLRSGRVITVPGQLTGVNGNDQLAWTSSSRHLLAVTDGRVRVVDVRTSRVTTPGGLPDQVLHVTTPF